MLALLALCAQSWALNCTDIKNMVTLDYPETVIISTIKGSGATFAPEDLACLQGIEVTADVLAAASPPKAVEPPPPAPAPVPEPSEPVRVIVTRVSPEQDDSAAVSLEGDRATVRLDQFAPECVGKLTYISVGADRLGASIACEKFNQQLPLGDATTAQITWNR